MLSTKTTHRYGFHTASATIITQHHTRHTLQSISNICNAKTIYISLPNKMQWRCRSHLTLGYL